MKKKINYIALFIGFLGGVLFYLLDLIVRNAETSSVEVEFSELFRNPNYFIILIYGIIGASGLFFVLSVMKYIFKL